MLQGVKNNNSTAVEGNFPINERLQMPREATKNSGYEEPRYSPRTQLPPIATQPAMNLSSPLKQPQVMMEQGKAAAASASLPPIAAYTPQTQYTLQPDNTRMMQTSQMRGNPVVQNMSGQPGPMNPQGYPQGANMVMSGIDFDGGGGGGGEGGQQTVGFAQIGVPTQTRPGTGAGTSRPTTAQDMPVVNRAMHTDFTPGMSYGGGFQLMTPNKPEGGGLRGLDQSGANPDLAFVEQKKMIQGSDGRFYVGDKEVPEGWTGEEEGVGGGV